VRGTSEVIEAVRAALRDESRVGFGRWPVDLSFDDGVLTMEGEVSDVAAKKLALERAAAIPEVVGIVDRLHTRPARRQDDATVRRLVLDAFLQEPAFHEIALGERLDGRLEMVRESVTGAAHRLEVAVDQGVVTLDGWVPGIDYKRLAGVLAWWVPGSRDVINGIGVEPEEEDSDAAMADAVRIVLEKDPFLDATRLRVSVQDAVVTLTGLLDGDWQRNMAELDAWYVFAVDRVVNLIEVSGAPVARPLEMPGRVAEWRVVEVVGERAGPALRVVLSEHEDEEEAVAAALRARDARAEEHADAFPVRWLVEFEGQEIDLEDAAERFELD
jgi:osmotically-inducible protein OsmY